MRVFQNIYKDRKGRVRRTKNWYVELPDHLMIPRRFPGLTDKRQTEALGRNIERLVQCKISGEPLDPPIHAWIQSLPPRLRNKLVKMHLLDGGRVASLELLTKHLQGELSTQGKVLFVGFRQSLAAKGSTQRHVDLVVSRVAKIIESCRFLHWSDVTASKLTVFLEQLRQPRVARNGSVRPGMSHQTVNFYLSAFKQFCRWMVRDGRASESPVAYLEGLNVKVDRRRDRRALTADELRLLLQKTSAGPARYGMSGPERRLLYKLAVETGLRRGELVSLTRSSFNLDPKKPSVTVEAAYSKHRRQDILPLRKDTAVELTAHLSNKMPMAKAFSMPQERNKSAKMFRADIEAAGLQYVDQSGRYADFHCLRHTYGSLLAAAGVHPKVAQTLMRHCTIDLTMSRYTHVFHGQEDQAVAKLPDLGITPESERANGTKDRSSR